jgi:hypothetical protein
MPPPKKKKKRKMKVLSEKNKEKIIKSVLYPNHCVKILDGRLLTKGKYFLLQTIAPRKGVEDAASRRFFQSPTCPNFIFYNSFKTM